MTGEVKMKNEDRGFGFISPDDKSDDVFFHFSGVIGGTEAFSRLQVGDTVNFEIDKSDDGGRKGKKKGPRAVDVIAS